MADPHNHTHQRRHTRQHTPHKTTWATLAITALIATVLAVTATPAGAAEIDDDSEPGSPATFTACLGPATDDAGFEDLDGLGDDTTDAINCLAYYGITKGRMGGTQFDPASNVTRGQMALFLYRAANAAGIDLMGGDMDAMYGDIDELSEERQAAIKALARNGILTGRNSMSFQPLADITRAEMAVALVNLVDHTPGAPVSKNKAGLFVLGATNPAPPDDWFADARASVPRHVDNAISAAYELGITTGYPNGPDGSRDFRPNASVPRRNMASFITRALAHSNLRPEGLTAQVDGSDVVVSIRNADFTPTVNMPIDAFRASVALESKAFKDDGTCSSRTADFEGVSKKCEIDGADAVTQTDGNARLTIASGADVGDGQTVWIWTGDHGDKVNADTDLLELSVVDSADPPPAPSRAVVSTDLPKDPNMSTPTDVMRVRFGSTVTVKVQLQGDSDGVFVDTVPAEGTPPKYRVLIQTFQGIATEDGADGTKNASTAVAYSQDTEDLTIGADGSASFTITATDPDSDDPNDVSVRYQVSALNGTHDVASGTPNIVVFSDEASRVEYVSVKSSGPQVAPGTGGSAGNAVTVTVMDQYGRPFSGAHVRLHSSNPTGEGDDIGASIGSRALVTRASGTVTIRYSYSGGASRETLRAAWDGHLPEIDLNTDGDTSDEGDRTVVGEKGFATDVTACQSEDRCGTTTVSWVLPDKTDNANRTDRVVLEVDTENDQIIYDPEVDANTPMSVNYDSNDFFTVVSSDGTTPVTITDFEDMLSKDLEAAKGSSDEDQPRLTYSSYLYDDPDDIATFSLTLGGNR